MILVTHENMRKILKVISISFFSLICHSAAFAKVVPRIPGIDRTVVKQAFKARECSGDKNDVMTIVDYSKPSSEKRLWVVDVKKRKVLLNTFVAHGKNSGFSKSTVFSNKNGSLTSSLGLFRTAQSYYGQHGYSLRLSGMEKNFNDNAWSRAIVVHGSSYADEGFVSQYKRTGRSWGCFAVGKKVTKELINTIKNGSLLFAYYPDKKWLSESKVLNC